MTYHLKPVEPTWFMTWLTVLFWGILTYYDWQPLGVAGSWGPSFLLQNMRRSPKDLKKSSNTMSERELTINSHVVFSYVQVCNRHIKSAGHSQLTWIQVFWWSNLCFSLKTYKLLSVLKILAKSWISWNSKLLVC